MTPLTFSPSWARSVAVCGLILAGGAVARPALADLDLRCTPETSTSKDQADVGKPFDITVNDDGSVTKGDTIYSNRTERGITEYHADVTGRQISYGISYLGIGVDTTIDRISGHFVAKATGTYQGNPVNAVTTGTCQRLFVPKKF